MGSGNDLDETTTLSAFVTDWFHLSLALILHFFMTKNFNHSINDLEKIFCSLSRVICGGLKNFYATMFLLLKASIFKIRYSWEPISIHSFIYSTLIYL